MQGVYWRAGLGGRGSGANGQAVVERLEGRGKELCMVLGGLGGSRAGARGKGDSSRQVERSNLEK